MRMNDIEYEFASDSAAKKNVARSARSARTHNGKRGAVKFPSDYLTKKEIKAMSGEVIQYASLKAPMSWKEFKELPNDLKKQYVLYIREKFGAPDKYIAEMFGVSQPALALYLVDAGCASGKGAGNGNKKWAKDAFEAWRSGATDNAVITEETESENTSVEPVVASGVAIPKPTVPKPNAVPVSGSLDFSGVDIESVLPVLKTLLNGQKLNFHVSWTVEGSNNAG